MDRASDSGSEGWGFESLPAYQKRGCLRASSFLVRRKKDSKGRPERSEGKKCPVDTFLVRGRVLWFGDASGTDVDTNQIGVAEDQIPIRVSAFLFCRRDSKIKMRMYGGHSLAAGLDGGNTLRCAPGTSAASPFWRRLRLIQQFVDNILNRSSIPSTCGCLTDSSCSVMLDSIGR